MIGQKLLDLAGVPPEKIAECLDWAFGPIDENESMDELRRRWNSKHADIFFVSERDNPKAFVWSIGKAYVDRYLARKVIVPRTFVGGAN